LVSDHISIVYKDRSNRLWVGTIKGLDMADLNAPLEAIKFRHFLLEKNATKNYENTIYSVFEDSKDQIWVGGMRGLYKFSKNDFGEFDFKLINEEIGLPDIAIRSINEDTFGRLIIGTANG